MEVHQIDTISVQSFCYHGKVLTEVTYVHGVYVVKHVVRVGLHCTITLLFQTQPCEGDLCRHRNGPSLSRTPQTRVFFLCFSMCDFTTDISNKERHVLRDMSPRHDV